MKKFQQQLGSFESLQFGPEMQQERRVRIYDYSAELIPFQKAWEWQRESLDGQLDRLKNENSEGSQFIAAPPDEESLDLLLEGGQDVIFMLQHEPVYTLGTGSDESFLLGNTHGVDVVRIERGGEVTYHGPGQLVVYPILDLRGYQQDIHWYMRALEEAILLALKSVGVTEVCIQG
jgi:lipoyl(octanoyl) transferase